MRRPASVSAKTSKGRETIRADFDRLASVDRDGWSPCDFYHPFLLKHIPPACQDALEIGCGTGRFARQLALRSARVLALDLSPESVRLARARSQALRNLDFEVSDILERELPADRFDCIVSVATLHHLPLDQILEKLKPALRPRGVLLVLDFWAAKTCSDKIAYNVSRLARVLLRLLNEGRLRKSARERQAWAEHGRDHSYLSTSEVRRICGQVTPGAVVRRHLLQRYSIVWEKPV
jgi:SAM-dependent methyltransferase